MNVIGNKKSKELHLPYCAYLKMAKPENLIEFDSIKAGLQNGYNGCGHCLKQFDNYVLNVSASIGGYAISEDIIMKEGLKGDFSVNAENEPWDVVIIGAGPVGLSSAKLALDLKLSVIVLEKTEVCGSDKRAETVNSNITIDGIWGDGFLKDISIGRHACNRFYSPYCDKWEDVIMIEAPHSFHWRGHDENKGLMDSMEQVLKRHESDLIRFNTEAVSVGEENDLNPHLPVKFVNTSKGRVYGRVFLDCSGYSTRIGRQFAEDVWNAEQRQNFEYRETSVYDKIINPIVKSNWDWVGDSKDYPDHFITFFIPSCFSSSVKDSPPGVLVIFPTFKGGPVEINFIVFDEHGSDMPREFEKQVPYVEKMWNDMKKGYPVFKDFINNLSLKYERVTGMPSSWTLPEPMYAPGLVFVGDSAGHVKESSSSGLETGMLAAKWWVNAAFEMRNKEWTDSDRRFYNEQFRQSEVIKIIEENRRKGSKEFAWNTIRWGENKSWSYPVMWLFTKLGYRAMEKKDAIKIGDHDFSRFDWFQQAATINGIIDSYFVLERAENRIIDFLRLAKSSNPDTWDLFLGELKLVMMFRKVHGNKDLADIIDIIGLSCFEGLAWETQIAIIQELIGHLVMIERLEKRVINLLEGLKRSFPQHWEDSLSLLDTDTFFRKMNGKDDLYNLYRLLGPISRVWCALGKESKFIIIRDVNDNAISAADLDQRRDILLILINNLPLGNKGENKILEILEKTKMDSGEAALKSMVWQAGGIQRIYDVVQGKERKRLSGIYPVYKSCMICGGDGRLYEAEVCPDCRGSGVRSRESCPKCHGSKRIDCWRCGGDGKIKDLVSPTICWNCNGTGRGKVFKYCRICDGDGKLNDNWPPPETCPKCNGSGKTECSRCNGTGELVRSCIKCGGDGWIKDIIPEQDCWNCDGEGRVLL